MKGLQKQVKGDIAFYSIGIYFIQLSWQWEEPTGILNYTN